MSSAAVGPPERRVPVEADGGEAGGGQGGGAKGEARGSSGSVAGISPSILIIAVIVVVMLLASVTIHYFIRHLCRHARGSSLSAALASSTPVLPVVVRPAASAAFDQGKAPPEAAAEMERLISRLPLFTLASSLATLPKSSKDCAVCQSAFRDDDELRLLPACRHAFHSSCVDPWLRANPSCPLCRASISLPHPPLPELLRVELGSVSSRRSNSAVAVSAALPEGDPVRAYPLPSLPNSVSEYLVEEELQVVIKQPSAAPPRTGEPSQPPPPQQQQQQQVAVVERGQPSSVTTTASFSSARSQERWSNRWSNRWSSRWSSGRWSSRYDAGNVTAAATAEWWWDMDGGAAPASRRREADEQGNAFYGFMRWITGAY
ncbi:hypothetical protein GUJ93_ZPchr0010g7919 [Zizania palustris]|uniref:RING-type domain-containing protein n=1 Tax=Zizania palustris TaxID=103762 RepID=A0A8J5W8F1_ZIZPA|nr:hypothetical protein GUJ93_ZPchr0010g7919 [Zizania palustris]